MGRNEFNKLKNLAIKQIRAGAKLYENAMALEDILSGTAGTATGKDYIDMTITAQKNFREDYLKQVLGMKMTADERDTWEEERKETIRQCLTIKM